MLIWLLHCGHGDKFSIKFKMLIKAISRHVTFRYCRLHYNMILHKNVWPKSCTVSKKYKSFFSHFTTAGRRPCNRLFIYIKNIKSQHASKSPLRSCIIISPWCCWSRWHPENTEKIQSGRIPFALCSGEHTKRLEEVANLGHFFSLTFKRVNIWCSLVSVQDAALPHSDISGSHSMLSLGIQNNTGGFFLFSVLENGVGLLQILYHREQPSGNTLTWLH